ncbi:MAG: hypothetical protein Q8L78_00685 [Coxiellaceae bacterium]|nr:hypothetical protein [Coxiellaceae bacterium]
MTKTGLFSNTSLDALKYTANEGFLPKKTLLALPEDSWLSIEFNRLSENLPQLLRDKKFGDAVALLNEKYKTAKIILIPRTATEKNKLMSILSILAQAIVFENPDKPKKIIPAVLAENMSALAQEMQRYPVMTYSDYILHNWRLVDPTKGFTLENIEPILTFTDSTDEKWFIKIHVAIEATVIPALQSMHEACLLHQIMQKNPSMNTTENNQLLKKLLDTVSETVKQTTKMLLRMKEHCGYDYFFNILRRYLASWDEKLGITFENETETRSYNGASGAQSSILPALDCGLDIRHNINGMYQLMQTFRQYMPKEHLFFILALDQVSISTRNHALSKEIAESLNHAIHAIQQFRFMHRFALVKNYIYTPAAKIGVFESQITGTGGTPISAFLEERLSTTRAKL